MLINELIIADPDSISKLAFGLRARDFAARDVEQEVLDILVDVQARGIAAVADWTRKFDAVDIDASSVEVPAEARKEALAGLEAPVADAMRKAAARIKAFSEKGIESDWTYQPGPGITVGQVRRPMETVGLYVPGGRFAYPSTVLMTGIPARVAGVGAIVFCIPPGKDGRVNPATLAATALVGGCRVFRIGGAQAVAAMAYGSDPVPACSMVAGPGNIYVATAKRLLSSEVTVDIEAGPSEVVIYAGPTARPSYSAFDLMAQLEHDPLALAVLVAESNETLDAVRQFIVQEGEDLDGTIDLVRSPGRAASLEFINALAPEHLELMFDDAAELLPSIRNAGCVFLGPKSAVALGDYIAGPSHVLPTGGSASRLSGLRAADFTRTMNVVAYTGEGLSADADDVARLASLEGLKNHARSVEVRKGPDEDREV